MVTAVAKANAAASSADPPWSGSGWKDSAWDWSTPTTAIGQYLLDSFQRGILFLDVLRRRGDHQQTITRRPMATVLRYDHQIILSGSSLPRPVNYYLARIVPPPGTRISPDKAPIIIIDPRAGQGPGIGGFRSQSEIGDALAEGHPVYFIGFSARPLPGQTFLDVVDAQAAFVARVVELHPDTPRPIAFGNCQAGYQTLMAAMLRPELFAAVIMAGSPMSYWQGVHGKNPMRYTGGLLGGSWATALMSDLGNGLFDGAYLIANFDNLNPANFLWTKQYRVYANIDTEPPRYLGFEKWWGDFIELGGQEIQYLVDQLFIGDKLTRNELRSNDGQVFDARNVTCPVICFASRGDEISPPPQALGWIVDLYHDVEDIKSRGRTIVYCIDPAAGHLAIFVSAKVAASEDMAFVRTLDMLEALPPGLYEMIVTPNSPGEAGTGQVQNPFLVRFEPRTLEDIRALGRNSEADDRAFATVERLSELNLSLYRTFVQPFVRSFTNKPLAESYRRLNPLRLSYTLFADDNPAMAPVRHLAQHVRAHRQATSAANPWWSIQDTISTYIATLLDTWREARDYIEETWFFAVYGSPIVQAMLGINALAPGRPRVGGAPAQPEKVAAARSQTEAKGQAGGMEEAATRALLYILEAEQRFDERAAAALRALHSRHGHLTRDQVKQIVRNQLAMLQLDPRRAIDDLTAMVPAEEPTRDQLLKLVAELVGAGGVTSAAGKQRLDEVHDALSSSKEAEVGGRRRSAVQA